MTGAVMLRPYVVPNFWTPLGASAKIRSLQKKGFPQNLKNWRFVTLSLDRDYFPGPEDGYEAGNSHLAIFVRELRRVGYSVKRWAWKMEFHRPDEAGEIWPHWHLLLDYKRPIPKEVIDQCWGMGRTQIKGVSDAGFKYLFKYVAKTLANIPDWILERKTVRLFQTSMGFYDSTDSETAANVEASPRLCCEEPAANTQNERYSSETLGERLKRWSGLVVSRSISETGTLHHHLHSLQGRTWGQLRLQLCRLSLAENISELSLQINAYKIETSCLRLLPHILPNAF